MAFTTIERVTFSDLVYHEFDPAVGYSRQDINVTPPAGGAAIKMGTVVFRAKDAANTFATPYTVLEDETGISDENQYAVVFGDHYNVQSSFVPREIEAGRYNAVGFVGKSGGLMLKDYLIRKVHNTLTEEQFQTLREVLAAQGIIVEVTL